MNKKYLLPAILLTALLVLPGCCLQHNWVPATCEADEYCSECGKVGSPATGHQLSEWITDIEPTCSAPGHMKTVCTICGKVLQEKEIERLDHTPSDYILEKDATCTEKGTWYKVCTVCGERIETGNISAHHTDGEVTLISHEDSTCHSTGLDTYEVTCAVCGEIARTYTEEVERLPHTFVNRICSVCNAWEPSTGLELALLSDYYTVKGMGECTDTIIVIPSYYNGIPVTKISKNAFKEETSITKIVIGKNLTNINSDAFSGCTSLTEVMLSEGLETIGNNAFKDCTALKEIKIPDSVTSIGLGALQGCNKLTMVSLCTKALGTHNMPYVFGCEKYLEVEDFTTVYPKTLKNVFIREIKLLTEGAFAGCPGIYDITVPSSTVKISDYAFYGCPNLTTVVIEDGVKTLGYGAFMCDTALTSIKLPSTLIDWDNSILAYCSKLPELTLPEGTTKIVDRLCYDSDKLKVINLPSSITSIAKEAFAECDGIKTINYAGTTKEWKALIKDESWISTSCTIVCTDGKVTFTYVPDK